MNKFLIAYFSGTGGVKKIISTFEKELIKRNIEVKIISLDIPLLKNENHNINKLFNWCDTFLLAFPVYAFNAPKLVYNWIYTIPELNKKTIVISVSGGGEVWPNTGTRIGICKALVKKGFDIVYENMMVMPSNWLVNTEEKTAMWLLKILTEKTSKIIDSILSGKIKRTKKGKGIFQKLISKLETIGASHFGREIIINSNCNSCGWCSKNCPVENITIENKKPCFHDNCIMCFRCIYGCTTHAMSSKNFMVLKSGFNLSKLENKMENTELPPIEESAKGLIWMGVKKYLMDKDGI